MVPMKVQEVKSLGDLVGKHNETKEGVSATSNTLMTTT